MTYNKYRTADPNPGDTTPGMCGAELADLAPATMSVTERGEFVTAALAGGHVDQSGDVYYDRLCAQLEMRLLVARDRIPEADVWWRYRLAKRAAQPARVDDLDRHHEAEPMCIRHYCRPNPAPRT